MSPRLPTRLATATAKPFTAGFRIPCSPNRFSGIFSDDLAVFPEIEFCAMRLRLSARHSRRATQRPTDTRREIVVLCLRMLRLHMTFRSVADVHQNYHRRPNYPPKNDKKCKNSSIHAQTVEPRLLEEHCAHPVSRAARFAEPQFERTPNGEMLSQFDNPRISSVSNALNRFVR